MWSQAAVLLNSLINHWVRLCGCEENQLVLEVVPFGQRGNLDPIGKSLEIFIVSTNKFYREKKQRWKKKQKN